MAEETTTKVYDVQIQGSEALKTLANLRLQSQELRDEQRALGKVTEDNAEQYYKLDSQIKAINQQAGQYQRSITNSIKLQNQQEASLERLRTQLSLDNAEMVKYGNEVQNAGRKAELQQRIAATTEELKRQEEALGDHRRSVGNYALAVKELRDELTSTTNQLIVLASQGDTSSEAYRTLAARAAELKTAQESVNQEINNLSRGTEAIQGITGLASAATAAFGLWSSATAALGVNSEEFEQTIQKLAVVMTALNSLTTIQNTLSRTSAAYRAAENILQKVGISQTAAETKALAAKNAVMTSNNVVTKAVAASTWLWNAALSANPVVLVVAGVAALVVGLTALNSLFGLNSEATERAERAQTAYNAALKLTEEYLISINRIEKNRLADIDLQTKQTLEAARQRGASAQELAAIEVQSAKDVAQAQTDASNARLAANTVLLRYIDVALAAREAEFEQAQALTATLGINTANNEEYQKSIENLIALRKARADLVQSITEEGRAIEQAALNAANAERVYNETISKEALDNYLKASQSSQRIQEEMLKAQNVYQTTSIKNRQSYERELFNLQQKGERDRLQAQRNAGVITAQEYTNSLTLLDIALQNFNNKQIGDLNVYYDNVRKEIIKQVGQTADEQIGEITRRYTQAMDQLELIQPPKLVPGMTDEEFQEATKKYEDFLYNRAEIERRLTVQMNEDIEAVREADLAKRISNIENAVTKEYQDDLAKYSDNEAEKLRITIESLQAQIAAKKAADLTAYEDEAALRSALASQEQLLLAQSLRNTSLNAEERYNLTREALQNEFTLYEGNATRQAEILDQINELDKQYFDERIAREQQYLQAISDGLGYLNDIWNAFDEQRLLEIEENYNRQLEALDKQLEQNLISQEQYDNQKLKLDKQRDKEEAKIAREQAIRERVLALFTVAMNTAMGIMNAVSTFWITGGMPWAAIIAALGAVQIAGILAQPLPKAASGMFVKGKSHLGGGERIEVEGGEAIINKRSSSMFLPLLSAINEAGGGIPFASPGSDGGYSIRSSMSNTSISKNEMEAAIYDAFSDITVVATIEDIRRADYSFISIEDRGGSTDRNLLE